MGQPGMVIINAMASVSGGSPLVRVLWYAGLVQGRLCTSTFILSRLSNEVIDL